MADTPNVTGPRLDLRILDLLLARRRPAPRLPAAPAAETSRGGATPPFAAALEGLEDPALIVSGGEAEDLAARRFVFANAAARALFLIQRPEGPLATAVRSPEVLEAVDEALFGGLVSEAVMELGGAQERVWRARAQPLREGDGGGRLALLTLRDETDIRRADRTRADFLANASHELRTPLASLTGFIETLRGHARDDQAARERFLGIMAGQAERMRRLIEDLMSLSRIELSEHIAPSGAVDLGLAVIDAADALAPLAAERNVAFRPVTPALGGAIVMGDRDQILQVIQNLAENALKYSPRDGEVVLEVLVGLDAGAAAHQVSPDRAHLPLVTPDHATGRRYAALRVADKGPGMAREHLPRLTQRFYRVEGQKSGERSGTGLGLAIVKHIVNRHRGGMAVESGEGLGTAFTAYFPMPNP